MINHLQNVFFLHDDMNCETAQYVVVMLYIQTQFNMITSFYPWNLYKYDSGTDGEVKFNSVSQEQWFMSFEKETALLSQHLLEFLKTLSTHSTLTPPTLTSRWCKEFVMNVP